MIEDDANPIVTDFGLARDTEGELPTLTRSGDLFGTPAYMSPEQLMGKRIPLDRRSDVYSLGVTLYECLTLKRPFEAPTREGLYQAILTQEPPNPRRIKTGPFGGLCVSTPANFQFVVDQLYAPLGTSPIHFTAASSYMTAGPFALPPLTVEAITFDFTGGVLGPISQVATIAIQ